MGANSGRVQPFRPRPKDSLGRERTGFWLRHSRWRSTTARFDNRNNESKMWVLLNLQGFSECKINSKMKCRRFEIFNVRNS